jgi:hypothetical protein
MPPPPPTPRGGLEGGGRCFERSWGRDHAVSWSTAASKHYAFTHCQEKLFLILFRLYNFKLGTLFNFKNKPQVSFIFKPPWSPPPLAPVCDEV